jgi:hypothetical protein
VGEIDMIQRINGQLVDTDTGEIVRRFVRVGALSKPYYHKKHEPFSTSRCGQFFTHVWYDFKHNMPAYLILIWVCITLIVLAFIASNQVIVTETHTGYWIKDENGVSIEVSREQWAHANNMDWLLTPEGKEWALNNWQDR